ncbi:hypothetical protein, partial [Aminipila sp.]
MEELKGEKKQRKNNYLKLALAVGIIAVTALAVIIMKSSLEQDMTASAENRNEERNMVIGEADKLALG